MTIIKALTFTCLALLNSSRCNGLQLKEKEGVAAVSIAALSSAIFLLSEYTGITSYRCHLDILECCNQHHISLNMSGLQSDLKSYVYGQHLAVETVMKAMKAHFNDRHPSKPLVMSFQGWTGGGKNYVARMIVKNIYTKGVKSSFVHVFNSEVLFKHEHQLPLYMDQLQQWLKGNVSRCARSIFIFDEVDHMPKGLIDSVKPFLGPDTVFQGVDFRRTTFILLSCMPRRSKFCHRKSDGAKRSNTGGAKIMKVAWDVWKGGQKRSTIKLRTVEHLLQMSAFNEDGGLQQSDLIHRNMIDHFVPFLPLERSHVRMCIRDVIGEYDRSRVNDRELVDEILEELSWYPPDERIYSTSGCKKVKHKVALALTDI